MRFVNDCERERARVAAFALVECVVPHEQHVEDDVLPFLLKSCRNI